MSTPTPAPALPSLPSLTSASSITTFAVAILGYITSFIVLLHPGFTMPTVVVALVAPLAQVIAGVAVSVVVVQHRNTTITVARLNDASVIPLPTWSDPASVASYLTTILSAVFAAVAVFHPGFAEPAIVQALLPIVGMLVSAGAQIVNLVTHHSVVVANAKAQHTQRILASHVAEPPDWGEPEKIDYEVLAQEIDPDELIHAAMRQIARAGGLTLT